MLKKTLFLTFFLCGCSLFSAMAFDLSQLQNDLKPVTGTIIMPIGEEFLIDIDASANLGQGDIMTLVVPGERIIQPQSKEVLGVIDQPIGFLQVTRVKSGYSYVKLLSTGVTPKTGDKIIRFEQVPAALSYLPTSQSRAEQIKAVLPQFRWQDQASEENPLLTFKLENNQLSINGPKDALLYQYALGSDQLTTVFKPEQPEVIAYTGEESTGLLQAAADKLIGAILPGKTQLTDQAAGARKLLSDSWLSPPLKGHAVGIAVEDFDGDGQTEIAYALSEQLIIATIVDGQYQQKTDIKIPRGLKLLTLETTDLDQNGLPELYLTAASGQNLKSFAVEYTDGSYNVFAENLDWYLRSIVDPDSGKILIGQTRGMNDNDFTGQPFKISRTENRLSAGEEIQLAAGVNLFSFAPFKDGKDQLRYAYLDTADKLIVSSEYWQGIWQSTDDFGGSEIMLEENQENSATDPTFISPRLLLTANNQVVVVQNIGPRLFTRTKSFNSNRLVALQWDGSAMSESWSTSNQPGYLADYAIGDANNDGKTDIVMLIQTSRGHILKDASLHLTSYTLE